MVATLLAAARPAAGHGVGGRIDLPIPVWQFAWAAALALVVSFAVLGRFWTQPRLEAAAPGVQLPARVQALGRLCVPLARLVGLLAFVGLLYAALVGSREVSSNIAPYAVFIVFWVGMQLVSAVIGDAWAGLNPFRTLADVGAWIRAEVTESPMSDAGHGAGNRWWAVGAMLTFVWMELAYHAGASPRAIGIYLALYTAAMLVGASARGRGWVRDADGFGVLFAVLAGMAPFRRDRTGSWHIRSPVAGLATLEASPATVRFILVVLGSTTFDGFARSSFWLDVVSNQSGWALTALNTGGLVFGIGVVMFIYRMAIAAMARTTGEPEDELGNAFAPSLVPIVVAYTVAHYFSYLVLDGQAIIRLASDPFGMGWDVFGTAGYRVDYTLLSPAAIAWIQTTAIAVGHVLAVLVAHDRAVDRYPSALAVRSQYPMLAAMIVYTLSGLFLLLGR